MKLLVHFLYLRLVKPSLCSVTIKSIKPTISSSFVAPSATIAGNVTVGTNSAVWYGAVIRATKASVSIGDSCSIGDLSVITAGTKSTQIGSNVSIAHGVKISDSIIENGAFIGEGVKLSEAHVASNAFICPGAVLPAGAQILTGQVWAGAPAALLRTATTAELTTLRNAHKETLELALGNTIGHIYAAYHL